MPKPPAPAEAPSPPRPVPPPPAGLRTELADDLRVIWIEAQAVEMLEGPHRCASQRETVMDYFRHVSAAVGNQPMMSRGGGPLGPMEVASAANLGEVTVALAPAVHERA